MTLGLHNVTVEAGGRPALVDIDVVATPGQIVAVVGGDGAGKTTVARTMVGLAVPTEGEVRRPSARRVGYLPATSGVWPDLTVLENLGFVADAHRIKGSERAARIEELLESTALATARRRLGSELSGGMRQKLGVAMAMFARPELMVLDEPSTGVDPVSRTELWRLMTAAALTGAAVVFTTTYLDEAERAHSITALEDGRIMAAGTMAEIAAAVPGVIVDAADSDARSWRRGRQWRSWHPDGVVPVGTSRVDADLTDLLVAATLAGERTR
jgi:ABC-2 type transport system ATP-binding protein